MITTALVAMCGSPAQADPITTTIAGWLGGGAFASTVAGALVQIGGSYLLSVVARKLAGKPRQEAQRSELTQPTSLPAYRFVYGRCWAPGTPVGWVVRGRVLYICYLLNSRESALTTHTVLFDKRAVETSGNPFDFAGSGAVATNDPFSGYLQYWIGRGDQTSCPAQIASESGYFEATDAWRGRTVLWARVDCGPDDDRSERWPATPPELNVDGQWSLVYDPRDNTTKFSRNQGLIVLDALMNSPLRAYSDSYLWTETFEWAADVASQPVAVKAGGTIPRYRCDGVLVWSDGSELEDQIKPLLAAGASSLVRVGGRLGIVPAVSRASVHTITEFTDGQSIGLSRWQASDRIYTEVGGTYVAPDRAYESADLPVYVVPGAQTQDGGIPKRMDIDLDFVTDHRQGQRLAKIAAMRSRMQRRVSGEAFPDAFRLVAGSICTLSLPWPYGSWNGMYEVETIHPAAGINDDQSITLRLPMTLRETSAAIYTWDAATEEQDVESAVFGGSIRRIVAPASVSVVSGADAALNLGYATMARVMLEWPVSVSASVRSYEWQLARRAGGAWGDWLEGGAVDATTGDGATCRAWLSYVVIDSEYRVRVRSVGTYGKSGWVVSAGVVASGPVLTLQMPVVQSATGGAGRIDLVLRQASDADATRIEVWVATVDDIGAASLLATLPAGASVVTTYAHTGLGSTETRHYWIRSRNGFGNASPFSASTSATTT